MESDGNARLTKKALILGLTMAIICLILGNIVWAENLALLQDIEIHPLPNNKAQLEFMFNCPVEKPVIFTMEDPKSLVMDFPSISSRLPKEFNAKSFDVGSVKSVKVIEAAHKTRVVLALKESVKFHSDMQGNKDVLVIEPDNARIVKKPVVNRAQNVFVGEPGAGCYEILSFDFQRGEKGEARLVFQLSNPNALVDLKQVNDKVLANFINACIPPRLIRRYDVRDFGTPLQEFTMVQKNNLVSVEMSAFGEYEKMAYQTDSKFIIEIRKVVPQNVALSSGVSFCPGEKLSINFQNIDVRAALQVLAEFSGFNLVACDSIQGNITLKLQDVPCDQALDLILKCRQLGVRKFGNVMYVAPSAELINNEKLELETLKQVDALQALRSEQIQINYAKAKDLAGLLKEKGNNFMSDRGNVSVDDRTNILLIQDTPTRLVEVKELIRKLDIPVSQVEIHAQIVSASDDLEEMLGVKFGGGMDLRMGKKRVGFGSTNERARAIADSASGAVPPSNAVIPTGPITNVQFPSTAAPFPTVATTEGLFADLPVALSTGALAPGSLALAVARLPNNMLVDLELQALEFENKVKTISRPKITTTNKTKAFVEQGVQIPFQQASSSGATSISFQNAVLRLEVTPQITPDGKIIMDLVIKNDSLGTTTVTQQGAQSSTINTNHLETQVLVDNGETIVLGGILTLTDSKTFAKIPFFGDLPFIGVMFRNKNIMDTRKEILIFITPKIVKPNEC